MKWLRLYDDLLDDPKAQQMSPVLFKHWINLLCLASKSEPRGTLPAINDVAFRLRVSPEKARSILNELVAVGMIDREGETLQMHNWTERQPNSDDVAARVRKHREGVTRNDSVTLQKRKCNALDTDTDTDTEKELPPTPSKGSESDPGFETFYAAYPRHEGKEAARKAWRALKPSPVLIDTILADIKRRLALGVWERGSRFIPMPGPYLNGKRWEDVLDATVAADPVSEAKAEKARLLAGQWQGQREALMYAPKSDGPGNVAKRIAELDRIITGQVAA